MARKTVVQLVDDVSGEIIKEGQGATVEFGIDGNVYSIDLSTKHATELHEQLEFWIQHAEKVSGGRSKRGVKATAKGGGKAGVEARVIRQWAADNRLGISNRGRVPQELIDQYLATH
ncbi:Lsr2 family protein [Rhodococcus fascians]|nr:Lsr2 family protein [Rhodococcus fascians]MBY4236554.1 Lsr2 family protein [Rhodococcus fascians]MBY4252079.1 Lsr2 family protein [Rhodococcus fascians]MBY4267900.1 Lsr2 family protein [Rhodococcus fascians]